MRKVTCIRSFQSGRLVGLFLSWSNLSARPPDEAKHKLLILVSLGAEHLVEPHKPTLTY